MINIIPKNIREKLIPKEEINEELRHISESISDYITPSGKVYNYYNEVDMYYPRSIYINNHNNYLYVCIGTKEGDKTRRLHVLVAKAYVPNPKPNEYFIVEHKDNNKQNPVYTNLMWSTNQHNTQKAVDDGLNIPQYGIDNKYSYPIKVTDLNNNLVAVYGSMREAVRNIENLDLSYISKILKTNKDYKTRNKKYKYFKITKEDYDEIDNKYKNIKLIENPKKSKKPSLFKAINLITKEEIICNNQKQFAKEHNLNQPMISHAILNNTIYNNWRFEFIEKINYKDASCYDNFMDLISEVVIENIDTLEKKTFRTKKELKDFFGLKGHDIKQYLHKNQLIFSKWRIISC